MTKETPIIMSGNHPKLVMDRIKTMTRRVIKHQPPLYWSIPPARLVNGYFTRWGKVEEDSIKCPYGQVGDRLWLRHRYDLFEVYYKPLPFDVWPNYTAGTDGHIYRMDKGEPYQLKEASTGNGYLSVSLSRGSYKATQNVHRLICQAFYGPDDHQKSQVRHLDGNGENNLSSNLDWGTQEDNWLDRKYHGRGMGEEHPSHKLTKSQVGEIKSSNLSQRTLAQKYRVSQPTIQSIIIGNTWQEIANQPYRNYPEWRGWQSPLFMPRWASRITLEITELWVELLRSISLVDALAEGGYTVEEFIKLYLKINHLPDDADPWNWAIKYKLLGMGGQSIPGAGAFHLRSYE